ncbi:MAG TPA: hypothetical protein VH475_18700, partial [Tepidisphaeraceae bacterium]
NGAGGIGSSWATGGAPGAARRAIGWADGADGALPGLAAGTILVRAGLAADANLNGTVDFNDLVPLAQNYNGNVTGASWTRGDFNYDGLVDFNDLVVLAQNYNASAAAPGAAVGVPVGALASAVAPATPVTKPVAKSTPKPAPKPAPKPVAKAVAKPTAKAAPVVQEKGGTPFSTLRVVPVGDGAAAPRRRNELLD